MYSILKKFKKNKKNKDDSQILNMAIIMFISFSLLNVFLVVNFINILSSNFKFSNIIEYKKIDNEYYEIQSSKNIYKAIN